jgi:ParB family chromosome partitioning protein
VFKTCKYSTEAIVFEGIDKGEIRKVCTQPDCSIHHPAKQSTKADASFKAEQDKRRKEEAQSNATGARVLQTIVAAVPVRLMKRDLLFIAEQMLPLLDDKRLEMVARHRGIRAKEGETVAKLLTAFVRKAEESDIGKLIVETVILVSARTQPDGGKVLHDAAQAYKVDTDAIALKVKQEFSAKERARKASQSSTEASKQGREGRIEAHSSSNGRTRQLAASHLLASKNRLRAVDSALSHCYAPSSGLMASTHYKPTHPNRPAHR